MNPVVYPAGLPCPAVSVTTPAERRLLSDVTGNRQMRSLQRDYLAVERIDWPVFTQEQADEFQTWWRDTLKEGGLWFAADWPSPQGGSLVRRFQGTPQWTYIHGGTHKRMWRVSAQCEVGGRRVTPMSSDVVLRLPFDTDYKDKSRLRHSYTPIAAGGLDEPLSVITSDAKVGAGSLAIFYAETGSFTNRVYRYDTGANAAFVGDFTIQLWIKANTYYGSPMAALSSNRVLHQFEHPIQTDGSWAVDLSSLDSGHAFRWREGGVIYSAPFAGGVVDEWWHLAIVRKDGFLRTFTDGIAADGGVEFPGQIGGVYPISIGGSVRDDPVGGDYCDGCQFDDIMISLNAEYDGDFDPPLTALRYR